MSKAIDERVVEMSFDNRQFESNVKTSMSTIDKLKQSLNFEGATKGLEKIDDAAKKVNMSSLGDAVDSIQLKFSALDVMAFNVLSNITNKVTDTALKIANEFTLEPIKSGFQEYETQINAVQTILANTSHKGTTLEQVNAALDELNHYADMTIYNFTEMTRNIGTFTAAGVDLDTSVAAIKGIANLAAVSGSNSQQASRAMYQLSQAIASGVVNLQDWNSVVNAGMGGQVFQNALKETAKTMGIVVDESVSFRESISAKSGSSWLTSEVLLKTLEKFTGDMTEAQLAAEGYTQTQIADIIAMGKNANDAATKVKTLTQLMDTLKEAAQSGWTQTWELIIGDFEQAKKLYTSLSDFFSDIINKAADARNSLLEKVMAPKTVELGDWRELVQNGLGSKAFENALIATAKEHGVLIDEMIAKEGSFQRTLKNGWLSLDILTETLEKYNGEVSETTSQMTGSLSEFEKLAKEVIRGDWGNGIDRKNALTEAGQDYVTIQSLVNHMLLDTEFDLEKLSNAELKAIGYTDEQVERLRELAQAAKETGTPINELITKLSKPSGTQLLFGSIQNILKGLQTTINAVSKAWNDVFPPVSAERVYAVLEAVNKFTESLANLEKKSDKLTSTFRGLFSVLDIIGTVLNGIFRAGLNVINRLLGNTNIQILNTTGSIGDAIYASRNWLKENDRLVNVFVKLSDYLVDGIVYIKEWIKSLLGIDSIRGSVDKLADSFSKFFETTIGNFVNSEGIIGNFIEKIQTLDSLSLSNIQNAFSDFFENSFGDFVNVNDIVSNVKESISSLSNTSDNTFSVIESGSTEASYSMASFGETTNGTIETVGTNFSKVGEYVSTFFNMLKNKISENVGLGEIFAVSLGASMMFIINRIGKAISNIANISVKDLFSGLASQFSSIGEILVNAASAIKAFEKKTKSESIYTIAKAIGVLALSLVALSIIPQDKMWSVVASLGELAAILIVLSFAISKMGEANLHVSKNGLSYGGANTGALKSIALSVLLLAASMKVLDGLDEKNFIRNLMTVAGMVIGMAVVVGMLGDAVPQLSKGSFTFLAIAGAVKILVGTVKDIDKMEFDNLGNSIALLIGAMFALTIMAKASRGVNAGAAVSILAISIAMKLLISCFDDIANIDMRHIKDNVNAFVAVFGVFAGLMIASRFAGANALKAGGAILAMSVAFNLIALALKGLSGIENQNGLNNAVDAVIKILGMFALITGASALTGQNAGKAGLMIIEMTGALILIAGALVVLSHVETGLDKAVAAVVAIGIMFGALIAVSKIAGETGKVNGTLITLATTMGLMAVVLGSLAIIDTKSLLGAAGSIAIVLAAISVLGAAMSKMSNDVGWAMFQILTIVVGLGIVLYNLASIDPKGALASSASLAILLLTLSESVKILGSAYIGANKAMENMVAMWFITVLLAVVLGAMGAMDIEASIKTATALSILMLSMAASVLILSKVGAGITAVNTSLRSMGIMLGIILVLVAIFAAINYYIPDAKDFLENGMDILISIGKGIGDFFGSIIGGFAGGLTAGLPIAAENLASFVENLQPFFDTVKNIDDATLNGVKNLAGIIIAITAAEVVEGLGSKIIGSNSLTKFAAELIPFSIAFSTYAKRMEGVNSDVVEKTSAAAKSIMEFAKEVPNQGISLLSMIVGDNKLSDFAEGLLDFAGPFVLYSKLMEFVKPDVVEATSAAALSVMEFAREVPNQGTSLLSMLVGDNTLAEFAKGLIPFAESFARYSELVSGVKVSVVEKTSAAAKSIMEFANEVPNTGLSLLSMLIGDNSLDTFGENLVSFGSSFLEYSNSVSDVREDTVIKSANAAQAMIELSKDIPNSGGLLGLLIGNNDFGKFGDNLSTFGKAFVDYSNSLADVDSDLVSETSSVVEAMVTIQNGIDKVGGLFSNKETLADFGDELSLFGKYFAEYYDYISDFEIGKLATTTFQVNQIVSMAKGIEEIDSTKVSTFGKTLKTMADTGIEDFIASFADSMEQINTTMKDFVDNAELGITTRYEDFATIGSTVISNFINGFSNKFNLVTIEANTLATILTATLRLKYSNFKSAGEYLMDGFAEGIKSKRKTIVDTINSISSLAITTANKKLGIASPSKVFYQIGDYVVQGFTNAIADGEGAIGGVVNSLFGDSINQFKDKLSGLDDVLNIGDNLNLQPVISPVMDLSDIQNGTDQIYGMMNNLDAYSIDSSWINTSSIMSNLSRDNMGDDGLSSVVSELKSSVDNLANRPSDIITNNFNITGDDPRAIADEVSMRLQQQVERRDVVWK